MDYRRIVNTDVSEVSLDCSAAAQLPEGSFESTLAKAIDLGVNLFTTLEPEATSVLGEALKKIGSRRNAIVTAGIADFFAAYTRHKMLLDEFLEHELGDRLERLSSKYLDCFVIDLGRGRSVDLEGVRSEKLSNGGNGKALALESFEGGTFLHETISDCLVILDRFKQDGLIRLVAVSGENIEAVKRVLVKHDGFDVALAPYSYGFCTAADELIPIAAETDTSIVATKALWWVLREIPVTVLAESPYPPGRASVEVRAGKLAALASKWPLMDPAVASTAVEVCGEKRLEVLAAAADTRWTREDEQTLRPVAKVASAQDGIFLILSAMNSPDAHLRARGWAAFLGKGLGEYDFDPEADEQERKKSLEAIASSVVSQESVLPEEDIEELL